MPGKIIGMLLFLLLPPAVFSEVYIKYDNIICRAVNTHICHTIPAVKNDSKVFVSRHRDLTLIPVTNPSNLKISVINQSFIHKNDGIYIKIDGKIINGKISSVNEFYFSIDTAFARGDSGSTVYSSADKLPVGLLSHQRKGNNSIIFYAVRFDNLRANEFDMMTYGELMKDLQIFQSVKEKEYLFINTLQNARSRKEFQSAVQPYLNLKADNPMPVSVYLKNETVHSINIINNIIKRFLK